jgi:hypothetical protein
MADDHYPTKITFGEMRTSGVRDVLIYCRDHRCSHHVETNPDGWADDVRLSDIQVQRAAARLTTGSTCPTSDQTALPSSISVANLARMAGNRTCDLVL